MWSASGRKLVMVTVPDYGCESNLHQTKQSLTVELSFN